MTPAEFDRTDSKLRSIAREVGTLKLDEWLPMARSKANAMSCASDRQRKCELLRVAEFGDALDLAQREFASPR